jgi:hypothetical protein
MTISGTDNALAALQGTQLFGRAVNLTIGFANDPLAQPITAAFNDTTAKGKDVSGHDLNFVVEKSLKPDEPNTCSIIVFNLSEASRQKLSGQQKLTVRLEAGYRGGLTQLYFAEARAAWSTRQGPDIHLHIESTDTIARPTGVRKTKKAQPGSTTGSLYITKGPRVQLEDAFRTITKALGIGEGNLKAALTNLHGQQLTSVNGAALIGHGARRMTDLCRSAGLEWSIQDGALQLLNVGQVLGTTQAILVSPSTGMIDSPSVDSQGAVSVSTLLIPGLAPGVLVVIDSLFVQGGYRVEKCRYVGSTYGNDWTCHFDAIKY